MIEQAARQSHVRGERTRASNICDARARPRWISACVYGARP